MPLPQSGIGTPLHPGLYSDARIRGLASLREASHNWRDGLNMSAGCADESHDAPC